MVLKEFLVMFIKMGLEWNLLNVYVVIFGEVC